MDTYFIGQGREGQDASVGQYLIESLENGRWNQIIWIVAFASSSGVEKITPYIEDRGDDIDDFLINVGVDQTATSKEALEALHELDIEAQVYHSRSPITFHPKVYLFEGLNSVKLIIGSSNLTVPGLFQNIESSLVVEYTPPDSDGDNLLNSIKNYYRDIIEGENDNTHSIDENLIQLLLDNGVIQSESARKSSSDDRSFGTGQGDTSDELVQLFPSTSVQQPPSNDQNTDIGSIEDSGRNESDSSGSPEGTLVWRKLGLPASDAQSVGSGTHVTGQMRLAQAGWEIDGEIIDQTTYFRYEVFGDQTWSIEDGKEVTQVDFRLIVKGDDLGVYRLDVVHDSEWEAAQRNVTTMIRWGDAIDEIKKRTITDLNFYLYRPDDQGKPYTIEIR